MTRAYAGVVSHGQRTIEELAADPVFAVEYLQAAMAEADEQEGKAILFAGRDG